MWPSRRGCIHLFRFAGIDVFLHWSWFLAVVFLVNWRLPGPHSFSSEVWAICEVLALFVFVLLHEFGHSLACRSVGGRADQIVLWPLGGVAFVDPPQRPGATLWSLVAGPLVNAILIPIFYMAMLVAQSARLYVAHPNIFAFIVYGLVTNVVLLCFNLLPIYPLDGGQILRSLLWFVIGRARSLMVACVIGLIVIPIFLILAIHEGVVHDEIWLMLIAVFALMNCWGGFQQARQLGQIARAPRRAGLACPKCHAAPPVGDFWVCGRCRAAFDMFATRGVCPRCGTIFNVTRCFECGEPNPLYSFGEIDSQM